MTVTTSSKDLTGVNKKPVNTCNKQLKRSSGLNRNLKLDGISSEKPSLGASKQRLGTGTNLNSTPTALVSKKLAPSFTLQNTQLTAKSFGLRNSVLSAKLSSRHPLNNKLLTPSSTSLTSTTNNCVRENIPTQRCTYKPHLNQSHLGNQTILCKYHLKTNSLLSKISLKSDKLENRKLSTQLKTSKRPEREIVSKTASLNSNCEEIISFPEGLQDSQRVLVEDIKVDSITFPSVQELANSKSGKDSLHTKQDKDREVKIKLLTVANQSLISAPNWFDASNEIRNVLVSLVESVSMTDPEFVLKTALYTRNKLNIRSTANFILALSAFYEKCRPFLKKYFKVTIKLPSDWTQVSEFYQSITRNTNGIKLPSALRKAMISKFPDFDEYQLGKYNKNNNKKEKKKKFAAKDKQTKLEPEESFIPDNFVPRFSIKYLIQSLHIADPAYHVMCLLGKKYPDQGKFYSSRLPGVWQSDLVGTRMKLEVPETWETMIAKHGNKAEVWQRLIDNRKLPFMAMLRNLRNLIKAGISKRHHDIVLKLLNNRNTIINSKQFPYRFFSAFEVIEEMMKDLDEYQEKAELYRKKGAKAFFTGYSLEMFKSMHDRKFGEHQTMNEEKKKVQRKQKFLHKKFSEMPKYEEDLLQQYKKALNNAINISTENNIIPISGRTLVLCDASARMSFPCNTAKGLGKPRKMFEIGALLGLMCAYSCESCSFKLFFNNNFFQDINLEKGGILNNLQSVVNLVNTLSQSKYKSENCFNPNEYLKSTLVEEEVYDNIIVITSMCNYYRPPDYISYIEKYRHEVNCNAMFYQIHLAGKNSTLKSKAESNSYVFLGGFSDQILQYIALRDRSAQVKEVDNIDKAFNLPDISNQPSVKQSATECKPIAPPQKRWKHLRVFISSTFKDTQAERNSLVRFVFPKLKSIGEKFNIHVSEIDLRWGMISREEKYENVVACLKEVKKCDVFVCILGQRYGWIPKISSVIPESDFSWLLDYPQKRSITELEIQQAILDQKHCYFYIRDEQIYNSIPKDQKKLYVEKSSTKTKLLASLKERVRESGYRVVNGYPCSWDEDKLEITDITQFCSDIEKDIATEIETLSQRQIPYHHLQAEPPEAIIQTKGMKTILSKIAIPDGTQGENQSGKITTLIGKVGGGKSTFIKFLSDHLRHIPTNTVIVEELSSFDGRNAKGMILSLCQKLSNGDIESMRILDFAELLEAFEKLLNECCETYMHKVYLFIDCFESLDDKYGRLEWIPLKLPQKVSLIISCLENSKAHKELKYMKTNNNLSFTVIPTLSFQERRWLVTSYLQSYSKKLDETIWNNQMQTLLSKTDSSFPLFLKSSCDLLRQFGHFENIIDILIEMPKTMVELLKYQLVKTENLFGTSTVRMVCAVILCSVQFGIKQDDICNVLQGSNKMITTSTVCTILHMLGSFVKRYVVDNDEYIKFSHDIHFNIVNERVSEDMLRFAHAMLAKHFINTNNALDFANVDEQQRFSLLERIPIHLIKSHSISTFENMLLDLKYIYKLLLLGKAEKLTNDFSLYFSLESKSTCKSRVAEVKDFIFQNITILKKIPGLIFQLALNEDHHSYIRELISAEFDKPKLDLSGPLITLENSKQKNASALQTSFSFCEGLEYPTTLAVHGKGLIAVGLSSGRIISFDSNGVVENIWKSHNSEITKLVYDANYLVASSASGKISVWNLLKKQQVNVDAHKKMITDLAFQPPVQNNIFRSFVSCSTDRTFKLWSCDDLKCIATIKTEGVISNSIDFHPTLPRVLLGMWDSTLKIWDIDTSKRLAVLRGHKNSVSCAKYSPCGEYIASCSMFEKFIILWSALHGSAIGKFSDPSLTSPKSVIFDEKRLLAYGHQIKYEDTYSLVTWNSTLGVQDINFQTSVETSNALCTKYIPTLKMLAVGFHDGSLAVYDTEVTIPTYHKVIHDGPVNCVDVVQVNAGRSLIITGSVDGLIRVTNATSHADFDTYETKLIGHKASVLSLSCSRKSKLIASGSVDCTIMLWSIQDLVKLPSTKVGPTKKGAFSKDFIRPKQILPMLESRVHEAPVSCVSFNNEGMVLMSGCRNGLLAFFDIEQTSFYKVKLLKPKFTHSNAHLDWITCCSWNSTDDQFATGSNDSTVKIWSCSDMTVSESTVVNIGCAVTSMAFKKNCLLIATGENKSIEVWSRGKYKNTTLETNFRTNDCDFIFDEEVELDESLNFSDDEDDDAIDREDWALMMDLFDWEEEHEKKHLPGKGANSKSEKQRMENVRVVSVGNNAEISIWKPLLGKTNNVISEAKAEITAVAMMNENIISTSKDGLVSFWCDNPTEEVNVCDSEILRIHQIDERHIATGSKNGNLQLWKDFKLVERRAVHKKAIQQIMPVDDVNPAVFLSVDAMNESNLWTFQDDLPTLVKSPASVATGMAVKDDKILNHKNNYNFSNPGLMGASFNSKSLHEKNHQFKVEHLKSDVFVKCGISVKFLKDKSLENGVTVYGDTAGYINIYDKEKKTNESLKFHDKSITGLVEFESILVSASFDCTVKVWEKENLRQVGQYVCKLPVSAMVQDQMNMNTVVCGDVGGNLFSLKLRSVC